MAACRVSGLLLSSSVVFSGQSNSKVLAILQAPRSKLGESPIRLPRLQTQIIEEVKITGKRIETGRNGREDDSDSITMSKLYALAEAVADRVEMHSIIGEQRADWNKLLLNSINAITLTAATMAGLSAMPAALGTSFLAFKLSSTVLYAAATGLLLVMNKIQPSQLAEEQRNAARLFRQLYTQIQTTLAVGNPSPADVDRTMEKILALDKAYPLPLLPGMLNKFPKTVEPTVWWPAVQQSQPTEKTEKLAGRTDKNGWSAELEEELHGVLQVLKKKDVAEYVRLSKLVLKVNRILAVSGPLLTGLGAIGAAFAGSSSAHDGSWPALLGVASGALATVVNSLEHGGQVGMVFEMYRNCGGFYHLLEESICSTLKEEDVGQRENGEVFEMKLAIQLGRSLSELRNLAASSHEDDKGTKPEFSGKLF